MALQVGRSSNMSHNITKVNSQEPDSSGEITQTISDLSDTSLSSISDGQFLKYSSSTSLWSNASASATFDRLLIGRGESNAYSNSGVSAIGTGFTLKFYDSSVYNTIPGASVSNYSSTNWIDYVTLPSGSYLFFVKYTAAFSSSGYMNFVLYNGNYSTQTWTGAISNTASIGETATSNFSASSGQILVHATLSASTDIALYCSAQSGVDTIANQGNTISENAQLAVIKIG